MAFTGGYCALYFYLARTGLSGSAQTGHFIFLMYNLLSAQWEGVLIRLGGMCVFFMSMVCVVFLSKYVPDYFMLISVIVDVVAIIILGFLPQEMDPVLAMYPSFFALTMQWCAFSGANNNMGSTIFLTNDLRQFFASALNCGVDGKENRRKHQDSTFFFGTNILFFGLGIIPVFYLWEFFGIRSIWFCLIPVLASIPFVLPKKHKIEKKVEVDEIEEEKEEKEKEEKEKEKESSEKNEENKRLKALCEVLRENSTDIPHEKIINLLAEKGISTNMESLLDDLEKLLQ